MMVVTPIKDYMGFQTLLTAKVSEMFKYQLSLSIVLKHPDTFASLQDTNLLAVSSCCPSGELSKVINCQEIKLRKNVIKALVRGRKKDHSFLITTPAN